MTKIMHIAKKYNLALIEDAAQAHGAEYKNVKIGNFSDFACFSFYPTKNLGAYGDGGLITTDNINFYRKLKILTEAGTVFLMGVINASDTDSTTSLVKSVYGVRKIVNLYKELN